MTEHLPRIIFVNRVYWPAEAATAQLLTDLAEGLAARGWEIHVIAAGDEPGLRHGVTIHRTGAGDQHHGILSRTLNYGRFVRRARGRLASLAVAGDIVVAMTDPPLLGSALAVTVAGRGASLVHWVQDIYPEIVTAHLGASFGLPLRPWQWKRDKAWRAAPVIVTVGTEMAKTIAASGVPAERITVVPNWAPREMHLSVPADRIVTERTDSGFGEKFIVAYSGNLGRVHEFAAVMAAAERLQADSRFIFLFTGSGARLAEVRSAIRRRGLTNVRLRPPVPRDELPASLAAADVQLVTLRPGFDGLVYPSKLAGVLAAGRPVLFVGSVDGEIAKLLEREQCGAAIDPADSAGLADTLRRWQAEPATRARLGRNARSVYEKYFAFEPALCQWMELLHRAGRPSP